MQSKPESDLRTFFKRLKHSYRFAIRKHVPNPEKEVDIFGKNVWNKTNKKVADNETCKNCKQISERKIYKQVVVNKDVQ